MNYEVTYPERLRNLCIENGWFSSGDFLQFEKLFYANENGLDLKQISAIIWVCSDGIPYSSIYSSLRRERKIYIASVSSDV